MVASANATRVPGEAARHRRCRSVLMVGTRLDVRGGISTVVRGYRDGGLFERFGVQYVATHRDGSAALKAWQALRGYVQLCRRLLTEDAPLVHIHMASRASFWRKSIVCALAMLRGRPYLLHVHGGEFGKFYEQECGGLAKWLVRTLLGRAALVLGLSDYWCRELARIAPRARIRRLPNAVRVPECTPPRAQSALRILCVGLITKRKGTFDLVRAFARVAPHHPSAQLICAGNGDVEALRAIARELGIEERVSCPGWISTAAMAKELAHASIFALPSYAEGLPMALLEGMSWGLPVLTTPVGGIPEVIEHERNGLLVAPGDINAIEASLARLLQSSDERARLGAEARASVVSHFSLANTLEELAAIYREFGIPERA